MTNLGAWLAGVAVFLSLLAFIGTQLSTHRTASSAYVGELETRLDRLSQESEDLLLKLRESKQLVGELQDEVDRLRRRLSATP
jgi:chromosome segregation ATPase